MYLTQEPLTMFRSCWTHFIPAKKILYSTRVRTTSNLHRLNTLVVCSQPGVEELLDVAYPPFSHCANQTLLSRQSAPLSKLAFSSEIGSSSKIYLFSHRNLAMILKPALLIVMFSQSVGFFQDLHPETMTCLLFVIFHSSP